MARAWIFQANPDLYDIDGALENLFTINWRVPQYASEILPGDPVVLWRSGEDAGIVGVGRVMEPPQESSSTADEARFARRGAGDGTTTMALLHVAACRFIPKDDVAEVPALRGHRIVTAPMGTVFPLTDEEWAALRSRLPEPPPVEWHREAGWPAAFSWTQRTKSVNPLPGGIEAYQDVLARILGHVDASEPAREELRAWISQLHDVTERRGALVANFLTRAGLLRAEGARIHLTPDAKRWLDERDGAFLLALVHGRVRYVGEMIAYLDTPRTTQDLLQHANEQYAMNWTSRGQIVRRRHLLGGLGAVEFDDQDRLRRTSLGDEALKHLTLAEPQSAAAAGEESPSGRQREDAAGTEPESSAASPPTAARPPAVTGQPTAEALVARLTDTAHDSRNPDSFEQATRDAFAFLGFDAAWQGGSGKTDVLLTAALGTAEQYRVVVDTKTTAQEAVSDAQIDWVTIDDHQRHYEADHAALVAPAFRGGRLQERARRDRSVALLTVAALADVVRQHEVAPLDLAAYRGLFEPDVGSEGILDQGDTLRRQLVLAAEIVRQIERLGDEVGIITPGDLYWNLNSFVDQFEGQRAERREIAEVCEVLTKPPLSLLRAVGDGYASLGSRTTTVRRLRLFADLVERGVPETHE